jgi:endonuclease YncB( thermonuclease family)
MGTPLNNLKARSSICLVFLYCLLTTVFFLTSPKQSLADNLTAKVVSALDGDTLKVLHNRHPERIRLSGIDCLEKGQDFGTRAKQATAALS